MRIEDINQSKMPIVKIDKGLDTLANKVLFPEKVKLANRLLKRVTLPNLPEER